MNFFIGFISSVLAFAFAPGTKCISGEVEEVFSILIRSVIAGFMLSVLTHVNGCNYRMMRNSKLDFLVNLAIASAIGFLLFCLAMYIVRFEIIGRWICLVSVTVYIIIAGGYNLFISGRRNKKITVYVSDPARLKDNIDYLGLSAVGFQIKLMPKNINSLKFFYLSNQLDSVNPEYFLADSQDETWLGYLIENIPMNLLKRTYSFDEFFEDEFEVVNLKSVNCKNWWELPTRLRGIGFPLVKRLLDITSVVIMALPAGLVLLICAVAIRLSDKGPVIYKQVRLGQFGKPFYIFKIRTMRVDSETSGAQWAAVRDSRVTKIGRLLRLTRIDELPQLWNIFFGEMSLVGPRPERQEFYTIVESEVPQFKLRLACKPGLTGWAQVNYPYGSSIHDSKMKLIYDLYYIKKAGFMLDLRVVTRTIVAAIKGAR